MEKARKIELKGQHFGRITALEATEKRDYKGSVIWKCRCDCGNEFETSSDSLVHGKRISCGCAKTEWRTQFGGTGHLTFVDGTCIEWLKNRKHRSDNTSGFRGVSVTANGNYKAFIGFKGKRFYLGTFPSFDEAVSVRLEAEERLHDGFVREYEEKMKK